MEDYKKDMILSCAVEYLSNEYFDQNGNHAQLAELSNWLGPLWGNKPAILAIIDGRHNSPDLVISKQIASGYPAFWDDLWRAVQELKVPRSQRPERTVT